MTYLFGVFFSKYYDGTKQNLFQDPRDPGGGGCQIYDQFLRTTVLICCVKCVQGERVKNPKQIEYELNGSPLSCGPCGVNSIQKLGSEAYFKANQARGRKTSGHSASPGARNGSAGS